MVAPLKPDKERRTGEFRCFHRLDAAGIILSAMSSLQRGFARARFRESRRSCRVPLKVGIAIEDGAEGRRDHRGQSSRSVDGNSNWVNNRNGNLDPRLLDG
jgi:hypothetical protein